MNVAGDPAQAGKPVQEGTPTRDPSAAAADPFGLWQVVEQPAVAAGGAVFFRVSGGNGPGDTTQASAPDGEVFVWTLPLTSGPGGSGEGETILDRRAGQVRAITSGLDLAAVRAEKLVTGHMQHADSPEAGLLSFSINPDSGPAEAAVPAPEAHLAFALNALATAGAGEAASFGLGEDLSRLASQAWERLPGGLPAGVNWEALYQSLNELVESVNRQLLHFAWVDTTLDGTLAARTTVNWVGDSITLWRPGLSAQQRAAHCRSLDLAMASRSANLRANVTVTQIAGKIVLATHNPLLAMALAWQFIQEVMGDAVRIILTASRI